MALLKTTLGITAVVLGMAMVSWAGSLGQIWDCRSNPKQDVTVQFTGGTIETGTLTCNWDDSRVLIVPEKGEITFSNSEVVYMKFPWRQNMNAGYFPSWRLFGPMILALVAVYGGLFWLYTVVKKYQSSASA